LRKPNEIFNLGAPIAHPSSAAWRRAGSRVERRPRDARVHRIYAGTNEIMREIIARGL
jgi:alkylation response protein AidB-like acyl-CoA dehydrogenase